MQKLRHVLCIEHTKKPCKVGGSWCLQDSMFIGSLPADFPAVMLVVTVDVGVQCTRARANKCVRIHDIVVCRWTDAAMVHHPTIMLARDCKSVGLSCACSQAEPSVQQTDVSRRHRTFCCCCCCLLSSLGCLERSNAKVCLIHFYGVRGPSSRFVCIPCEYAAKRDATATIKSAPIVSGRVWWEYVCVSLCACFSHTWSWYSIPKCARSTDTGTVSL